MSLRGGVTRLSLRSRKTSAATAAVASCLVLTLAGCGAGEGVADDAVVAVYAERPQCAGAERALASRGGRAGDVRVRVVCLPAGVAGSKLVLATLGANARRATEDSAAVAYIAAPNPAATRFTLAILEPASISQLTNSSGAAAMSTLLRVIESADTSTSLRESVSEQVG